jgi:hypothetical protein
VRVSARVRFPLLRGWIALLLAGACTPALAQSSSNVPLDHPAYRFTEFLDTLGLLDSRVGGIRPFTRLDLARQLVEARDHALVRRTRSSDLLSKRIEIFQDAFRSETGRLLFTDAGEGETYFKPIQSVRVRYAYKEGAETPERDFGRVYNEGSQLFASASLHGSFFDFLSFHARP